MPLRRDAGFTLIELLVVAGTIVVAIATLGTFFLGGSTPAVAAAARDIDAAFHEARATAVAAGAATVVFTTDGTGYSARVYRQAPGDPAFAAAPGPTYASTVAISETSAPLGAPGFAFRIDLRGSITGYEHFHPGDATFDERPCPASGSFTLALAYAHQQRTIALPCTLAVATLVAVDVTPPPATPPSPAAPGTCAPASSCTASLPPFSATCPPGYAADGAQPDVCDSPTPVPTPSPIPTPPSATPTVPSATPTAPNATPTVPTTTTVPSATPVATPSPAGTPNYPWTAVMKTGAHQIAAGDWDYYVEVDIDHEGTYVAEACFAAKAGTTINWPTIVMSAATTPANLESLGVPDELASTVLDNCRTYRYGDTNPLAGSF